MAVYVDNMKAAYRGMQMSHMWADTLDELWAMVDKIGVQRRWIQGHPIYSEGKAKYASWLHFDIAKKKRALAIKAGAIETDKYGPIEHTARFDIASGDSIRITRGERKLEAIAKCRAMGFGG